MRAAQCTAGSGIPWLSNFVSRTLGHRDYTLDALRGLAIVGMILVNGAPPTDSIYAPLVHAPWLGWTLADTVFPLFLFVVGVSIALAMRRTGGAGGAPPGAVYGRIVRRAVLLFAIDMVLVNFPYYEFRKLQLTGVLTHIGVCYLVVALVHLHATWRVQLALIPTIWLVHSALLGFLDVPGFGAGILTPEGNASRYLDQVLLGPHSHSFYPGEIETSGVLAILSSITTTIIGLLAGVWMQSGRDGPTRIAGMFAAGFVLLVLGHIWTWALPVSKPLWTASYAALTAGVSLQLYAAAYWLIEVRGYRSWAKPLRIAGVNALTYYILAGAVQRVLVYGRIAGGDGNPVRLRYYLYEQLVLPWAPGKLGALLFVLVYLLICYVFILVLYRKMIFIKL